MGKHSSIKEDRRRYDYDVKKEKHSKKRRHSSSDEVRFNQVKSSIFKRF